MTDPDLITIVPALPDWYVIRRHTSGSLAGLVERSPIIAWQVETDPPIVGEKSASIAWPITLEAGDLMAGAAMDVNGNQESAHLPGGRRHQWEIDAATAKSSNRPPDWVPQQTTL